MLQIIHFKNDVKQIVRDPIMAIMMLAPLLTTLLFKLLVVFLIPLILTETGFNTTPYSPYILAFVLLINSGLLGIVTGFLMLDERDGSIAELMSVTPLGRSGYLINRLSFASLMAIVYSLLACYVLNVTGLPWYSVIFLSFLSAIYAAIIGLLIYSGADDKVKGLTFAKALNSLVIFAFADLLPLKWLMILSWFFPPYWITVIIKSPESLVANLMALLVHLAWLGILVWRYWRK